MYHWLSLFYRSLTVTLNSHSSGYIQHVPAQFRLPPAGALAAVLNRRHQRLVPARIHHEGHLVTPRSEPMQRCGLRCGTLSLKTANHLFHAHKFGNVNQIFARTSVFRKKRGFEWMPGHLLALTYICIYIYVHALKDT